VATALISATFSTFVAKDARLPGFVQHFHPGTKILLLILCREKPHQHIVGFILYVPIPEIPVFQKDYCVIEVPTVRFIVVVFAKKPSHFASFN
jgi:hypothetical protein